LENAKGVSKLLVKKSGIEWPSFREVNRKKTIVEQNGIERCNKTEMR